MAVGASLPIGGIFWLGYHVFTVSENKIMVLKSRDTGQQGSNDFAYAEVI